MNIKKILSGCFIITGDNDMRGYYFIDNSVIQPKYKEIRRLTGTNYLQVKTAAGKLGYINTGGDEYFAD